MDCSMKAALYVRVSTEEQAAEGQSIAAQIDVLTQYCKLYNIAVYDVYKDLGISGKEAHNRPGLMKMLQDAKQGCFNIVLVWKISRLSRSLKDLLMILEELEQFKVVFSSYSEKFDTSTAVGRMTLQLLGTIAEFERNTIVDNVKLGLQEFAKKGGKTGTVLGYDNIGKRLVVNEDEAEIVKLIYRLYTQERLSMASIAEYINKAGYRTKRGNHFRKDGIAVILGNPVYIGLNRHKIGHNDSYQTAGTHQQIIDTSIWEKAQKLRESNKLRRPTKVYTPFLLSGKVLCPSCNTIMSGFSSKTFSAKYRYYRCYNCSYLCRADYIEAAVLAELEKLILHEQVFNDTFALAMKKSSDNSFKCSSPPKKRELDKTQKLMDKYVLLLDREGFAESEIIIEKIKELENKLKELQIDTANNTSDIINIPSFVNSRNEYVDYIKNLFRSQDIQTKRAIIDATIKNIVLNHNKTLKKIRLTFGELDMD